MYQFLWILAGTLMLPAIVSAQPGTWTLLPSSPDAVSSGRHEDMSFPTPDRGYVVNFNGELHRTTDGGQTWEFLHSVRTFTEQTVRFRSVGFANENKGWIGSLTPGYVLFQTNDGGQTLNNVSSRFGSQPDLGICGIWVVNENVVYAVGRYFGPARLYMTKDGGLTWAVRNMDQYAGRLIDVYFMDELNGFVVGGSNEDPTHSRAIVLRTRDGGSTWEVEHVSENDGEWGWKISFPTPETGYVSVERFPRGAARVLKTTDGGESWIESVIDGSLPLQGIGFVTKWQGWAGGRGTTSRTMDGGVTWQAENVIDGVFNRFRAFGDTLAYALGSRVYKYVGKTQVSSDFDELPNAVQLLKPNYPNPFYPLTTFEYEILASEQVHISVHNLLGQLVTTLVDQTQSPGAHRAMWDGRDEHGARVGPGVYLYTLTAGNHVETRKMVLLDSDR